MSTKVPTFCAQNSKPKCRQHQKMSALPRGYSRLQKVLPKTRVSTTTFIARTYEQSADVPTAYTIKNVGTLLFIVFVSADVFGSVGGRRSALTARSQISTRNYEH
jgi:hypothetical protein